MRPVIEDEKSDALPQKIFHFILSTGIVKKNGWKQKILLPCENFVDQIASRVSGFDFPHGVNEEVSNRLQDALVVRDERDRWCDSAESSHGLEGDIQDLGVGMNSRYEVFGCS